MPRAQDLARKASLSPRVFRLGALSTLPTPIMLAAETRGLALDLHWIATEICALRTADANGGYHMLTAELPRF
jgi:hypothetical protein